MMWKRIKSRFAGGSGCTSNPAHQRRAIELYYFASGDRTSKLSYRFWAIACIANRISSTIFQAYAMFIDRPDRRVLPILSDLSDIWANFSGKVPTQSDCQGDRALVLLGLRQGKSSSNCSDLNRRCAG